MELSSAHPGRTLLQLVEKVLPSGVRAAKGLPLVGPEAPLLHAQMRTRARRSERECDHARQAESRMVVRVVPCVGEGLLRLDRQHLAVQRAAPLAAEIEAVT